MTALRLISSAVGLVVAIGYFWMFRRSLAWSMERGHVGHLALTLGLASRQLILGGVLAVLVWGGLDLLWLVGGVVVGTGAYRALLCGLSRR